MSGAGLATAARLTRTVSAGRMVAWRAHAYSEDAAGALALDAARRPVRRAPDDLLVRVHASSINPIDLAMIRGYGARVLNTLRALEGGEGVEFPLTPGRDFSGTVEAAAPGAALAPGTRVWGVIPPHRAGAHAEYVLVKEQWVSAAPERLDALQAGGALYGALTACAAVRAGGLGAARAGGLGARRVLVLGLGGVGHPAAQLLVRDGHHVVVGCSGEQSESAERLGAAPLDRHREDYAERLRAAGPFDAVFDCAGLGSAGATSLPCVWSVYVTLTTPLLRRADALGLLPGFAAAGAELVRDNIAAGAAGAAGGAGCSPRLRWAFFSTRARDIEMLRRYADRGEFTVEVEQAWGWRDAGAAYARAARGHARGKLLIDFREP